MADLDYDFDRPLTPKVLSDPDHKVVEHIMYIYSMESFIYSDLNRVCREKDKSKIKYYGAFAAALSFIINSGNKNVKKQTDSKILYRGVQLTQVEISKF